MIKLLIIYAYSMCMNNTKSEFCEKKIKHLIYENIIIRTFTNCPLIYNRCELLVLFYGIFKLLKTFVKQYVNNRKKNIHKNE